MFEPNDIYDIESPDVLPMAAHLHVRRALTILKKA